MNSSHVAWPLRIICVLVAGWLLLPLVVVIPLSFTANRSFAFPPKDLGLDYYVTFLTDPDWVAAFWTSVILGLIVTVLASVLGTAASFTVVRWASRFAGALNSLLLLPMMLPQIVVALAIYMMFLRWGLVGTWAGFILAHTALAIPFVMIPVVASLRGLEPGLEQAAASLGASRFSTLRHITIPLIAPGVGAGAVLAFATSFDEVVISLYVQSPFLRTLPVQMYNSVTSETDPTIAAASVVIITITTMLVVLTFLLSMWRIRRKGRSVPISI